ncbi:PDZ/DHR/GLGF domain protein, partial [Teladorsagia circumcincta]
MRTENGACPLAKQIIWMKNNAYFQGIVLDADKDKGVNGAVVKSICSKKAISLDGRIQVGDYIVRINQENLRNVTSSQARAILRRTNLIGTQCNVTYITAADARVWKERFHHDNEGSLPVINRLSPKVFPKFYRSPYLSRRDSPQRDTDDTEPPSEASEVAMIHSPLEASQRLVKEEAAEQQPKNDDEKPLDRSLLEEFALNIIK